MNIAEPISAWLRALPGLNLDEAERVSRLDLIGIDMAPSRKTNRSHALVPVIVAIVIGALLLVGLRNDITRMRYASADALTLERKLRDEKRSITVQFRRLREPKLLSVEAAMRGFAKPDRVITLHTLADVNAPSMGAEPRP